MLIVLAIRPLQMHQGSFQESDYLGSAVRVFGAPETQAANPSPSECCRLTWSI